MRFAVAALAVLLLAPRPAAAWGFEAHRFIMGHAIDLLPAALRTFFESRRAFIVERSIDPDLWRSAGFDQEPPNHFVDLDYEAFGPYPFQALPREYDLAVQKFGREVIDVQGRLPWRGQEFFGKLQRSFASLKERPTPRYAFNDIAFFSAILAHYVGDAHAPLHAVVNYDGQLTNQHGLHARWEAELFERLRSRLKVAPAAPRGIANPRDSLFDALLASNRLAQSVLDADKKATEGRRHYDDAYFDAMAKSQHRLMEDRVNDSITAIASMIVGAWEQAGRPALTSRPPEPRAIRP
jgi:hypothetical protein